MLLVQGGPTKFYPLRRDDIAKLKSQKYELPDNKTEFNGTVNHDSVFTPTKWKYGPSEIAV